MRWKRVLWLAVCMFPVMPTAPAIAQQPPPAAGIAAAALARIDPGSTIRVQTMSGEVLEGAFRLGSDSVFLDTDAGRHAIAFGDVRSAWLQQRQTKRGAIAGSLLGAAAGGAFMGLLAFVAADGGDETATLLAIGILGGGAAGGLLGGVVGAAVPRWTPVYPAGGEARAPVPEVTGRAQADPTVAQAGRRRVGSIEGAAGYGLIGGDEGTGGGAGGRLALHAEFGAEPRAGSTTPFLTVGPEVGWFDLGSTDPLRRDFLPADTLDLVRDYKAITAGGVLRGGLATPAWRAYALAGLAYNRWVIDESVERWISEGPAEPGFKPGESRFEHLGYTAGAGMQANLPRRTVLGLELRRTSVGTFDMDLPGGYWTLTVTAGRRW